MFSISSSKIWIERTAISSCIIIVRVYTNLRKIPSYNVMHQLMTQMKILHFNFINSYTMLLTQSKERYPNILMGSLNAQIRNDNTGHKLITRINRQ